MKRIMVLFLIAILVIPLFACTGQSKDLRSPVAFYYRTRDVSFDTDAGIISCEYRDGFGHEEDYVYLVEQYLNGPVSENCISPFPAGTTLVQLDFITNKVLIVLSSHISLLSGPELTIACTCLAKTVLEMTGMKEVKISSDGDLLNGNESITISMDDISFTDDYTVIPQ